MISLKESEEALGTYAIQHVQTDLKRIFFFFLNRVWLGKEKKGIQLYEQK